MAFISSHHLDELRLELLKRIELSEGRIEEIDTAVGEVRRKVEQLEGTGEKEGNGE